MKCKHVEESKCASCNTNKVIIAEENKRTYRLNNKSGKKYCKVKIDGCYITQQGKKCDYLIIDCESNNVYFVELKGNDLLHAIEQVDQTIDIIKDKLSESVIYARIVLTRVSVPRIENNPTILKLEKRLKKSGGNLKKGTNLLEEDF